MRRQVPLGWVNFQSASTATRKKVLEEQRAKLEAMPTRGGVTAETKAAIREALGIT